VKNKKKNHKKKEHCGRLRKYLKHWRKIQIAKR
jgi:hypothetical protein